ncbi:MFS transporter [Saccharothrix obliqua]|uniref:MFS transporter n=1 Tax=Saccharothrix obliqua TaxID=2861747 RepID=UPI001C5D0398|nr:MFS transporter [Saccharothrix obliqua]MBW4717988.1 MFS transporter [Saccharothrix obliqua]
MPIAVYVLGLGIFSVTTSEFMVSGLMPALAADFGVSISAIGYLISVYAAAMALGGPVLTVGLLRFPRKNTLLLLFGVFILGQALGAVAESYEVMLAARVITGVAASSVFGMSFAIAVDTVGPERAGRAASIVVGGLMIGTVLGLPAATWIGQQFGWRASFWAVGALTLLIGLITLKVVPATRAVGDVGLKEELTAFRNGRLWAAYATSTLIIGATFVAFSYFTPILTGVSGFGESTVPVLLAVYGVATVLGNVVVGRFADRHTMTVLAVGLVSLTASLAVFGLFADIPVVAVVALVAVGLVGVTMNPAMAARVIRTSNGRPLVNTVHTSVITFGVVIGSWTGGLAISAGYGLRAPLWIGVGLAVLGLLSIVPELLSRRAPAPAPAPATAGGDR